MDTFERSQVTVLRHRLAETPERIIAIFGPRQTGKTTIVHQALRRLDLKSRYLAVDEPDPATPWFRTLGESFADTTAMPHVRDVDWLARHWEAARREAEGETTGRGFVLVFDEIQKIAGWSDAVCGTPIERGKALCT